MEPFEISVVIYIFVIALLFITKPAFIFNNPKVFRQFGLSNQNALRRKTLTPLWLLFLVLATIIYYSVITQ